MTKSPKTKKAVLRVCTGLLHGDQSGQDIVRTAARLLAKRPHYTCSYENLVRSLGHLKGDAKAKQRVLEESPYFRLAYAPGGQRIVKLKVQEVMATERFGQHAAQPAAVMHAQPGGCNFAPLPPLPPGFNLDALPAGPQMPAAFQAEPVGVNLPYGQLHEDVTYSKYELTFDDSGRMVLDLLDPEDKVDDGGDTGQDGYELRQPSEDGEVIVIDSDDEVQIVSAGRSQGDLLSDEASLLQLLPTRLQASIDSAARSLPDQPVMEVQVDLGRGAVLRFQNHKRVALDVQVDLQEAVDLLQQAYQDAALDDQPGPRITADNINSNSRKRQRIDDDLDSPAPAELLKTEADELGQQEPIPSLSLQPARVPPGLFGPDNRLGIPGTLHRISAIRTRDGGVSGLTYRLGRHLHGVASIVTDLLFQVRSSIHGEARRGASSAGVAQPSAAQRMSILVVGQPGRGKTTLLRDMARVLSDELDLAVIVVDSSMEIGGAATKPHPALGSARRMEVRDRSKQQDTLIEAVQNHTPDVVIVDEIGTAQEVAAVRTIAERGISMIGTAHGIDLGSLVKNPVLSQLLGGIKAQTIGDMAASKEGGVKTRLERAGPAAFTCLIEVLGDNTYRLHHNLEESVDRLLMQEGRARAQAAPYSTSFAAAPVFASPCPAPNTELRQGNNQGSMHVCFETFEAAERAGVVGRRHGTTVSQQLPCNLLAVMTGIYMQLMLLCMPSCQAGPRIGITTEGMRAQRQGKESTVGGGNADVGQCWVL